MATPAYRDPADRVTRIAPRAASSSPPPVSASGLVSTLIPVLVVAIIFFTVFLVLRRLFPRVYAPRTFIDSLRRQEQSPALPKGLLNWFGSYWNVSDTQVLNAASLDGFLFLRLLKVSVATCLVGCVICMPVLFAVNATGPGGQRQLDLLSMSNATSADDSTSYFRWFAHAGCAWLFFGFVIYMITRESIYYVNLRQAYLVSPLYSDRVSSKTVLFTSVPDAYLNEATLREILGSSVVRVWIPRVIGDLEDKVEERDKVAMKLEAAEVKLVKLANQNRLKSKGAAEDSEAHSSGHGAARWLDPKKRPTHKLKPLIGKKVDTIDWCRAELSRRIPEVDELQANHAAGKTKPVHSVFVQFASLREAQSAYQSLTHHQPLHMSDRYTGIFPEEVIWSNLDISWWSRVIRGFIAIAAVAIVCIFWTVPVAAIGAISNITQLTSTPGFAWLSFLEKLPPAILGIVSGLLPTILLAVLMALLPIFLRFCAKFAGSATLSEVEYRVQNYYFAFQVLQVFLINTLASGIIGSLQTILPNPASAPALLAKGLPTASNFYINYFILQGLGVVSTVLVALTGLVIFIVLGKLLDKTPRKMLTRWIRLSAPGLGTVYPIYTNLFVIAIAYSVIAPLVLIFAVIGLWLFYVAYRYEFLYVYGAKFDTKGLMYPRALQQLFVGLYIAEICIIGLFAIGMGSSPTGAVGPLIMMILLLVFTALYHISLNNALDPLLKYLPKTLETEERRLLAMEEHDVEATHAVDGKSQVPPTNGGEKNGGAAGGVMSPAPHKKPNFITKFFRPDVYTDYYTLRRLVPRDFSKVVLDEKTANEAYHHPCVVSQPPVLWIPRDDGGVSRQEVIETSKVIPISDVGAALDEKNKIVWAKDDLDSTPVYQDRIYY